MSEPANIINFSSKMPTNGSNVSDRTNSFTLGRSAYIKNINNTHLINNMNKNIDYSNVLGKHSSIVYGKPLNNVSGDLRIQRLRLTTIGAASMRLNNNNSNIYLNGKNNDFNFVNNALTRVRGGGSVAPKKGK
jgi:hypothetical protein